MVYHHQQTTDLLLTYSCIARQFRQNEIVFSGIALGYADESAEVNELRSQRGPLEDWATFYSEDWDTSHTGSKL